MWTAKRSEARGSRGSVVPPKGRPPALKNTQPLESVTCNVEGEGGLGLVLILKSGAWEIKSLHSGEAAERNGQIKVGDSLVSVSSIDVRKCSATTVRDMLMGEPGTAVRLGLERMDNVSLRIFFYEVDLRRNASPTPQPQVELNVTQEIIVTSENSGQTVMPRLHSSNPALSRSVIPNDTPTIKRANSNARTSPIFTGDLCTPVSLSGTPISQHGKSRSLRALEQVANGGDISVTSEPVKDITRVPDPRTALENEIATLKVELEAVKNDLVVSRAETAEARQKARIHQEKADGDAALRSSEEMRITSIQEREERAKQLWREEAEKRKEAEEKLLAAEALNDELGQKAARSEAQIRSLTVSIEHYTKDEISSQAKFLAAQQELRDSRMETTKLHTLLSETEREAHATQHRLCDELKMVQEQLTSSNNIHKLTRAELEGMQKRYSLIERAWEERGVEFVKNEEATRGLLAQHEKDLDELRRLKHHVDRLETELDKVCVEFDNCNMERALEKAEIIKLRSKNDALTKEIEAYAAERQEKVEFAEREKQLQDELLQTEQQRQDLDSKFWLSQERRNQDLAEFTQLRNDYAVIAKRRSDLEQLLNEKKEELELLQNECVRLREKTVEQKASLDNSEQETAKLKRALFEAQQNASNFHRMYDSNKSESSTFQEKLEEEKVRRLAADARERETRQNLTSVQESIKTLQLKLELAHQDNTALQSQVAKLRQDLAISRSTLESQSEEIMRTSTLLRSMTNELAALRAGRSELEMEKSTIQQYLDQVEQVNREYQSKLAKIEVELEQSQRKNAELMTQFKFIQGLKRQFEDAEREKERFLTEKSVHKMIEGIVKTPDSSFDGERKSIPEKEFAPNVQRSSPPFTHDPRGQPNSPSTKTQTRSFLIESPAPPSNPSYTGPSYAVQSREKSPPSSATPERADGSGQGRRCGIGATFSKSGGGFVCTSVDVPSAHELGIGDLVIAMDDIPVSDVTTSRFQENLKGTLISHLKAQSIITLTGVTSLTVAGPTGTSVKLLVARYDKMRKLTLAPTEVHVKRRLWIAERDFVPPQEDEQWRISMLECL